MIEAAANDKRSCSDLIGRSLFSVAAKVAGYPGADRASNLTARETEILQLLTYGWSNKQIARALQIELATVKNHLHNAFRKLGVHNRIDARHRFLFESKRTGRGLFWGNPVGSLCHVRP